jgi:RluA family pseudouridine synthase
MGTNTEVPIIWQDEHILVINKPAGLLSLPDGFDPSKDHLKSVLSPQYGPLWIVHRLDRFTSGVMILARNKAAHKHLNTQFQERQVKKVYRALIEGDPNWDSVRIDQPLSANRGRRNRTVVDLEDGKPAVTRGDVLERFGKFTLVEAAPETGRRHQIRAHLASLGYPIAGDKLYGGGKILQGEDAAHNRTEGGIADQPRLERPALHARVLELRHPSTNKWIVYEALHPSDLQLALDNLSAQSV